MFKGVFPKFCRVIEARYSAELVFISGSATYIIVAIGYELRMQER